MQTRRVVNPQCRRTEIKAGRPLFLRRAGGGAYGDLRIPVPGVRAVRRAPSDRNRTAVSWLLHVRARRPSRLLPAEHLSYASGVVRRPRSRRAEPGGTGGRPRRAWPAASAATASGTGASAASLTGEMPDTPAPTNGTPDNRITGQRILVRPDLRRLCPVKADVRCGRGRHGRGTLVRSHGVSGSRCPPGSPITDARRCRGWETSDCSTSARCSS
jgi:hypothetical protein